MTDKNKKAELIEDYLKRDKLAYLNKTLSVNLNGRIEELPVYRFSTDLLTFNLENTRFEIQKMKDERENGAIDQNTEKGRNRIKDLLLNTPNTISLSSDSKLLKEDILKHGQKEPGIITYDGAVLNGNRRLACLLHLNDEFSDRKYRYFIAARLPEGTSEEEMFRIEADLQWANDFKIDYNSLNKYMMLRKAQERWHMGVKEIAQLTREKEGKVKDMIDELRLIEEYLKNNTKNPNDFSQIWGQTENFTDAVKLIRAYKERGNAGKELTAYKKVFFWLIDENIKNPNTIKHTDIRDITSLYGESSKILSQYQLLDKDHSSNGINNFITENRFQVIRIRDNSKPDKLVSNILKDSTTLSGLLNTKKVDEDLLNKIRSINFIIKEILERFDKDE